MQGKATATPAPVLSVRIGRAFERRDIVDYKAIFVVIGHGYVYDPGDFKTNWERLRVLKSLFPSLAGAGAGR